MHEARCRASKIRRCTATEDAAVQPRTPNKSLGRRDGLRWSRFPLTRSTRLHARGSHHIHAPCLFVAAPPPACLPADGRLRFSPLTMATALTSPETYLGAFLSTTQALLSPLEKKIAAVGKPDATATKRIDRARMVHTVISSKLPATPRLEVRIAIVFARLGARCPTVLTA